MGTFKRKPVGMESQSIPYERTALDEWLYKRRISRPRFAKFLGVHPDTVTRWCYGSSMPTLVGAFCIEKATAGAVPVEYWLGTILGKAEAAHIRCEGAFAKFGAAVK